VYIDIPKCTQGRVFTSIAGASIYMACQLKIGTVDHRTYEQISEWTGDMFIFRCTRIHVHVCEYVGMGWPRSVGSIKL